MPAIVSHTNPLSKNLSPYRQAKYVLIFLPILWLILWLAGVVGVYEYQTHFPWLVAISMLLLFAIGNCIYSFNASEIGKYWTHSIIAYIAIALVTSLFAYIVSGIPINEAKSYTWLYILFTFIYLLMLSIVNAMRKILEIVLKQDARIRGEE